MFQTIHKYIKLKKLWNFSFEKQKKKHAFDSFFQKKRKRGVWGPNKWSHAMSKSSLNCAQLCAKVIF